jgi:predicted nucleotidyltransferase
MSIFQECPFGREEKVSDLKNILQQQKDEILATADRYRAVNVRLFGSVARGDASEESDIDLLVDFLPGSTLLDQVALIQELSAKLGRKVDVVSSRALNKHLRQRILNESIDL